MRIISVFAAFSCLFLVSAAPADPEVNEYDLLKDFNNFIHHFGHDAIGFLHCMGPLFVTHCSSHVLKCLNPDVAIDIQGCIAAIKCEGQDAVNCVKHLHDKDKKNHPATQAPAQPTPAVQPGPVQPVPVQPFPLQPVPVQPAKPVKEEQPVNPSQ